MFNINSLLDTQQKWNCNNERTYVLYPVILLLKRSSPTGTCWFRFLRLVHMVETGAKIYEPDFTLQNLSVLKWRVRIMSTSQYLQFKGDEYVHKLKKLHFKKFRNNTKNY